MKRPSWAAGLALALVLGVVLGCGCTIRRASPPATETEDLVLRRPPPPRAEVVTEEAAEPSPFLARVHERGRGEGEEGEDEERATSLTSPGSLFHQPSPFAGAAGASPPSGSLPRTVSRPLAPPDELAPLPEPEPEPESEPRAPTGVAAAVPLDEAFPPPAHGRRPGLPDPEDWAAPAQVRPVPPPVAPPRPAPEAETFHVVVRGDTLWGIARGVGSTPQEICDWNPGLTPAAPLRVGQPLRLPGRGAPPSAAPPVPTGPAPVAHVALAEPPPPPSGDRPAPPTAGPGLRIHVLQPGETLWTVARAYRTSVLELMKINRIGEASALRAGLELYVPATGASAPVANLSSSSSSSSSSSPSGQRSASSAPEAHVVQKGDTLWSVSRQYGVSVEQLLSWNDMGDLTSLPVGARLSVARPSSAPAPTATPSRPAAPAPAARPTPRVAPTPPPTRAAAPAAAPTPSASPPTRRPEATGEPGFDWPLRGEILKNFGWYDGRPHTGIDIAGKAGTQVRAAADGTVIFAGEMRGYGTVVILDHGDGYFTVYGNLLDAAVAKGSASRPSRVARGSFVGRIGATVEGPQASLHFEIRRRNKAIAPLRFLTY